MYRFILFWALLVLLAAPAWGADTNKYPETIIDSGCTDANDEPAAYTPSQPHVIGGRGPVITATALVQTSGDPDGFCDNDSRILVGVALDADTLFGPFKLPPGARGLLVIAEANAVVETGVGTWKIDVQVKKPHNAEMLVVIQASAVTAESDEAFLIGMPDHTGSGSITEDLDAPIPLVFYVLYNEVTATAWTGDMSMVPIY